MAGGRRVSLIEAWPGKTRFICGGRAMVGPRANWLLTSLIYLHISFTSVVVFGFILPPITSPGFIGSLMWIAGVVGCISTWYFALSCSIVDPGIVPRDWMIKDLPETEFSRKLLLPEGANCDHVCRTCNIVRPKNSHHCSMCDHCVVGFDHHCAWLGVCIGSRNRKAFILLLTNVVILAAVSVFAGVYRLWLDYDPASATVLGHTSLSWFLGAYLSLLIIAYGFYLRYGYLSTACKMGGALLCLYLFVHGYWEITPDNPLKGSTLAAFWMVFWKGPVGVGFWFFMMVSWDTLAQGTTTKAVLRKMTGKPALEQEVSVEDGVETHWYDAPRFLHEVKLNPYYLSLLDVIIKCVKLEPFPRTKVLREFLGREQVPSLLPMDATYDPDHIPKPRKRPGHTQSHGSSDDPFLLLPCCKDPEAETYDYSVPAGLELKPMKRAAHGTCQHSHTGGGHGHSHDGHAQAQLRGHIRKHLQQYGVTPDASPVEAAPQSTLAADSGAGVGIAAGSSTSANLADVDFSSGGESEDGSSFTGSDSDDVPPPLVLSESV